MTRITHFKQQPVNVQYWDYYILCHLNTDATLALQRMEYWDGTKEDGNTHAEDINDVLEQKGQTPTQDTSRWIYKSQDELQWELMGAAGEKRVPKLIRFLTDDLNYLECRNNPLNTWDRKKQYEFKDKTVQEHVNYLGYIVSFFNLPLRRLCPVFYAIEMLTAAGTYIDTLNVDQVITKIETMRDDPKIPHFLKAELEKFFQSFIKPAILPFRTFAEWKTHSCGMHSDQTRNRKRTRAESIPQERGSNSIEFKTENSNIEYGEDSSVNDSGQERDKGANAPSPSLPGIESQLSTTSKQLLTKGVDNQDADPGSQPHQNAINGTRDAHVEEMPVNTSPSETPSEFGSQTQEDASYSPSDSKQSEQEDVQGNQKPERPKKPTKKEKMSQWFTEIDLFYRKQEGYEPDFQVPRTSKVNKAISELIDAHATIEQFLFVLEDIFKDTDPFWQKNRTVTAASSQFATRIPKMKKVKKPDPPPPQTQPQSDMPLSVAIAAASANGVTSFAKEMKKKSEKYLGKGA